MPKKPVERSTRVIGMVVISVMVIIFASGLMYWLKQGPSQDTQSVNEAVRIPVKKQTVIDFNKIDKDMELKALMQKRKEKYGVETGVDMITRSDESFKIGDATVPMQEILEKIRLKTGDIVERDLTSENGTQQKTPDVFGIYVVQPEDNIWNIHFKFLKDYFDHKGVPLSPLADEPDKEGRSSHIGKILKFSEKTVNIYNIKEHRLDVDLDHILPLTKVVVYNMDQIFELLDKIDYQQLTRIQFDGETLWITEN
jgi:hypothetical protein